MAYSKEGIPNNLNEILENTESFEVYFQDIIPRNLENVEDYSKNINLQKAKFYFKSEYLDFFADRVAKNISYELKQNLILSLLEDIRGGGEPSRCWIPHHGIRAVYNDELIELTFCFMCGWFRGEISDERFYGTFPDEKESLSKAIFDEISKKSLIYTYES